MWPELNYVTCDDLPVVFTQLGQSSDQKGLRQPKNASDAGTQYTGHVLEMNHTKFLITARVWPDESVYEPTHGSHLSPEPVINTGAWAWLKAVWQSSLAKNFRLEVIAGYHSHRWIPQRLSSGVEGNTHSVTSAKKTGSDAGQPRRVDGRGLDLINLK